MKKIVALLFVWVSCISAEAQSEKMQTLFNSKNISCGGSKDLTWQYGQFGLMTEYVVGSDKAAHLVFQLFAGAGFTMQYDRYNWRH